MKEFLAAAAASLLASYLAIGSPAAASHFSEFHGHIYDWLVGRAWSRLGRWAVRPDRDLRAAEVADEVIIRVWRTWQRPHARWQQSKGSLAGWLTQLVDRSIVDLYREDRRRERQLAPAAGDETRPESSLPAPGETPPEGVALADLLDDFLRGLDEGDRRLLELKMYHDLSQGEIAVQLGISDTAVSRRLKKLIQQLTRAVKAR